MVHDLHFVIFDVVFFTENIESLEFIYGLIDFAAAYEIFDIIVFHFYLCVDIFLLRLVLVHWIIVLVFFFVLVVWHNVSYIYNSCKKICYCLWFKGMHERLDIWLSKDVYYWLLHSRQSLVENALPSFFVNRTFSWTFEVFVQILVHFNVLCQLFICLLSVSLRFLKSTVQSFNLILSAFFDSFDRPILLGFQFLYFALQISR